MKQGYRYLLLLTALCCLLPASAQIGSLIFEENKGQWDSRALYRSVVPGGEVYLEKDRFRYLLIDQEDIQPYMGHEVPKELQEEPITVDYQVIEVELVGANPDPEVMEFLEYGFKTNYFLGDDPSKWAANVRSFGMLRYKEVYPGIDLEFIGTGDLIKYQFIVHPGGDPRDIKLRYRGQEAMVLVNGDLIIQTTFNIFKEQAPTCFQGDSTVVGEFQLSGSEVNFDLDDYNPDKHLTIDPVVVFSTYSGSSADNFGHSATYDSRGNFYSAGTVRGATTIAGGRYPATPGAFQSSFQGGNGSMIPINSGFPCDVAISKYDSSGQNLIWASYLGGNLNDFPHSLVVDAEDRLVVFGTTFSQNFPKKADAYDDSLNGALDIFLAKFNTNGTDLLGVTFVGGDQNDGYVSQGTSAGAPDPTRLVYNYADHFRGDVIVQDTTGNILVATTTLSTNFPTVGAFQSSHRGLNEGVIFMLDSNLQNLLWSTFVGGDGDDAFYSIKLNKNGEAFCAGGTSSNNLLASSNALEPSFIGGRSDGFYVLMDLASGGLKHLSYYGTPEYDQVYFADIDRDDRYYLFGQTEGNMSMTPGVYGQANNGLFIAILGRDLLSIEHQTTIGSRLNNPNLSPSAFVVDKCEKVYISGWGSYIGGGFHEGSTLGLQATLGAIRDTTDGHDFYLAVLDKNLNSLVYATFFGGDSTNDHVDGGTSRFDKNGVVYQSICGSCPGPRSSSTQVSDIYTTPGAAFPKNVSPRCSNTSFKIDFQLKSAVEARLRAQPKVTCAPDTITFINFSVNGETFIWDFGDGSDPDTADQVKHFYADSGVYTVTLVAIDSNTCNIFDTARTLVILVEQSQAEFEYDIDPCLNQITFTNLSEGVFEHFWDLGDGETSTDREPVHDYEAGVYNVALYTNPGTLCADSFKVTIDLESIQKGDLFIPNVFTPDGDGFNPCYQFDGLFECDELELEVFNRWAMKVYETDDVNFCWDGKHKDTGEPLSPGVYYVVAKIRQLGKEEYVYKGTITIIRDK